MSQGKKSDFSTYFAVLGVLAVLWIGVTIIYRSGAGGVRFGGAGGGTRTSFNRDSDFRVLGLRDGVGIDISGPGDNPYLTVIALKRGAFPFCPLCGTYEPNGGLVQRIEYKKDDWYYRGTNDTSAKDGKELQNIRVGIAFNQKTGERAVVAPDSDDSAQIARLAELGLSIDDKYRITPEALSDLKSVSMINESCFTFNAAFIALIGAVLFVMGIKFVRVKLRRV